MEPPQVGERRRRAARTRTELLGGNILALADRFDLSLALVQAGLLVHFAFPEPHRRQIRSTNPLARLNKEIPVLNWCVPEGPRRRPVRWVTVPRPDSKEISGATSFGWLSAA